MCEAHLTSLQDYQVSAKELATAKPIYTSTVYRSHSATRTKIRFHCSHYAKAWCFCW